MFCSFVDDCGVHGENEQQLDLRSDAFEAFCNVFGKPINTKFWEDGIRPAGTDIMVCAGVEFCPEGVRAPMHTIDALGYCLTEHKQNTLTEMLLVQGALNSAESVPAVDLARRRFL